MSHEFLIPIDDNMLLIHFSFFSASTITIYYDSANERITISCFFHLENHNCVNQAFSGAIEHPTQSVTLL